VSGQFDERKISGIPGQSDAIQPDPLGKRKELNAAQQQRFLYRRRPLRQADLPGELDES
jgi:hypothetical protein